MTRAWHITTAVVVWAVVLAGAAAPPALAQDNSEFAPFRMVRSGGGIFIQGWDQQDVRKSGGISRTDTEFFVEEGIDANGSGFVYHPNFLEWNASVRGGLDQDQVSRAGQDESTNGTLLGYSLSGLFLKEKMVSFRAFASQSQDVIAGYFARSDNIDQQRQGGEVVTRGSFPANFLLEHTALSQDNSLRVQKQDSIHGRASVTDQRSPDWLTQMAYEHYTTSESLTFNEGGVSTSQDLPDQSDEFSFSNFWRFGGGPVKHILSGQARYLTRTGFFQDQILAANQRLELNHTKTFQTFYSVDYQDENDQDLEDRRLEGEIGFDKKIYESLDIRGRLTGYNEDFGIGQESALGGLLDLNYNKQTPIGQYISLLEVGRDDHTADYGTNRLFVQGERVTLTGLSYSQLSRPGVVSGSVAVSDLTRLTPYREGVDYLLQTFGAFTQIVRVPSGTIADGQTVLVDYAVGISQKFSYTTDTFAWNNRLNLKQLPLALYVNYHSRIQTLTSGENPNLDQIKDLLLGTEVNWHQITAAYEHETTEEILAPNTTADRVRAGYSHQFNSLLDLAVGGQMQWLKYENAARFNLPPGQDFEDSAGGYLNVTYKLQANAIVHFKSDVLKVTGRDSTLLWRNSLLFEWKYAKLDFSLELRHDQYEEQSDSGASDAVFFKLRRAF